MSWVDNKQGDVPADKFDVFISYASEDGSVAVALADLLTALGIRVWLDRLVMKVGASLRRSIDQGLANSSYGVVILSRNFLRKPWPQRELDGLVAREMGEGRTIVLPVWHEIDAEEIRRYSPPLADKLGLRTSDGIRLVAEQIASMFGPLTSEQRRLADIAAARGFWFRSIEFSAHVMQLNTRWQVQWQARIVSARDGLEGISISYRIDDLLPGSLIDSVQEKNVQLETRPATHPRAIERFFRTDQPLQKGEEQVFTYLREFRKTEPSKPSDLFVSKVATKCDSLLIRVSFDRAPTELLYRVTDRGVSVLLADQRLALDTARPEVQRIIAPPDRALTYGFYWSY